MAITIFIVQQSVPVTAEAMPVQIILDAGHGGEDGGASTANGVPESQINLEIATRMEDLFALVGRPVQMIRTEDISIYSPGAETLSQKKVSDLKNRVSLINSTENALLVSIHQNTYTDSKYHGAQVFYAATADSEALGKHLQTQLATFLGFHQHAQGKRGLKEHLSHAKYTVYRRSGGMWISLQSSGGRTTAG